MSTQNPPQHRKIRRDGWTAERQLRFLDALAHTRSITKAATSAGMSRESAYRLRERPDGTLFALLWDRVLAPNPAPREVHNLPLSTGRIMRLLGNHYRRERGDFLNIGGRKAQRPGT
ncbi:MAG: hypothetical protein V4502_11565 [Pseudomonadota bacterium]